MKRQAATIYVWHGKAYLPLQGQFESGIWVGLEPVQVAELSKDELVTAIQRVLTAGHPRLPNPTREEWQRRKDPVLAATKARSWKALARNGASYSIDWTGDKIRVDMSKLDNKGRWVYDVEKVRIFPSDTSLQVIVDVILGDIRSRPELLQA
jgi:hypothetical protein